MLTIELE